MQASWPRPASPQSGLLTLLSSPLMIRTANLTWIPEDLLTSPGLNSLVDATTAYLFLYPLMQVGDRPAGCG